LQGLAELRDTSTEPKKEVKLTYVQSMSKQFNVHSLVDKLDCEVDKNIIICIVSGKSLRETSKSTGIRVNEIDQRLNGVILDTIQLLRVEGQ